MRRRFNFDTPTATVDIPGWYEAEPGTADKYTVRGLIGRGDISEIYDATGVDNEPILLKVCRSSENNDLMENEFGVLTAARTSPQWIKEGETKLPLPRESFHIGDNRRVTSFALTPGNGKPSLREVSTLAEVHIAYPVLDPRDAAWMFNRIIDALHCLHATGFVHGAVTPDHFIIEPESHRGQLLDFGYAVRAGGRVTALSPDWRSIYAPEILGSEPVTPATDIYMAAQCMCYLLGISSLTQAATAPCPLPMFRFLKACLLGPKHRIQNTWQVHDDFRNVLTEIYGERKFRVFSMPR
jgi:serine/threonine protein kinase